MLRCWDKIKALSHEDREPTQRLADLEAELWSPGDDPQRSTAIDSDWLQRNRSAQQQYNALRSETRRSFDQELLAFEAKVLQAQQMIDGWLDADILPISKWAVDLVEEAREVRKRSEDLPSARGEGPSAPSHDVDPQNANDMYCTMTGSRSCGKGPQGLASLEARTQRHRPSWTWWPVGRTTPKQRAGSSWSSQVFGIRQRPTKRVGHR